jgi:hypothetical protein
MHDKEIRLEFLPASCDGADDVRQSIQIAQVNHFTG